MSSTATSRVVYEIEWRTANIFLLLHGLLGAWAVLIVLAALGTAAEAIDGSVSFARYLALYVGAPLVVILSLGASMVMYETERYRYSLAISVLVVVASVSLVFFGGVPPSGTARAATMSAAPTAELARSLCSRLGGRGAGKAHSASGLVGGTCKLV